METLVVILMFLIYFAFAIKTTFLRPAEILFWALLAALFSGFMWKVSITQSKEQISAWLSDNTLMLDTAVLLSIEVFFQIAFAFISVEIDSNGTASIKKRKVVIYNILRLFPGVLIFAVIFSTLTYLVFSMPGEDFRLVAWGLGGVLFLFIPLCRFIFIRLVPEKDLRAEVFFVTNLFIAIIGVVATVNGSTANAGVNELNIGALCAIASLSLICAATGLLFFFKKTQKS